MPKGGAAPDERELRRLALAVRMYQEGRPHWELPAGERHSRVWEWVWCAAEWALWMLLLLWDLLSRGPPLPERAPPRASSPHPTPPRPPHTSLRTWPASNMTCRRPSVLTIAHSPILARPTSCALCTLSHPHRPLPHPPLRPPCTPLHHPHPPHPPHPTRPPHPPHPSRPSVPDEPTPHSGACRHGAVRPGHPELRPARPPRRRLRRHPLLPRGAHSHRHPSLSPVTLTTHTHPCTLPFTLPLPHHSPSPSPLILTTHHSPSSPSPAPSPLTLTLATPRGALIARPPARTRTHP